MRLAKRTFLWTFLPASVLLTGSFWMVERQVMSAARAGVRASLRDQQTRLDRMFAINTDDNRRALAVAAENSSLKAGFSLLGARPNWDSAVVTVQDQLLEIGQPSGFDLFFISGPDGRPLAGVIRDQGRLIPLPVTQTSIPESGLLVVRGRVFRMYGATVQMNGTVLGKLIGGDEFNASEVVVPVVLMHAGMVVQSSVPNLTPTRLEEFMRRCGAAEECEGSIAGESYLSMALKGFAPNSGYSVRTLRSVDADSLPMHARLRRVFLFTSIACLAIALATCMLASRSVARPIERLVEHLRRCEARGDLREFAPDAHAAEEVRALAETFSRAAAAARKSSHNLRKAYIEFVELLANALDARDAYTAGHSARVSQYSCAIAQALNASRGEKEIVRIGALLHDIGKIGIADQVLQKPGRLTNEEYELLKQHPTIGRRILEGVREFDRYLPVVELHHENWDGTGYPHGQQGEETPRAARIVHVADAYDAMTSDRPYRKGLGIEAAVAELKKWSGHQFDPEIVKVFVGLLRASAAPDFTASLVSLAESVEGQQAAIPVDEFAGKAS